MALIACPECHQQISDAALSCPHCGYPLMAAPQAPAGSTQARPESAQASRELLQEFSSEINQALRQAGLGNIDLSKARIGQPTITTRVFTTTSRSPDAADVSTSSASHAGDGNPAHPPALTSMPTAASANVTFRVGYGYDYRSKAAIFGIPLLAISKGYDPTTGRKRVAKGIIAIGDVAFGLLAIGGVAFGGMTLGGLSVGLLSLGGLSLGLLLAIGGCAIGTFAFGGLALGLYPLGGGAFGLHAFGANNA